MARTWNRSIVTALVCMLCSGMARLALTVAVGKLVFDLTHSELALGMLGLAEFAPGLLFLPFTGTLADRVDRRRLAAVAMVWGALAATGMAVYASTDPTSSLPIFGLVFMFGVSRAFSWPAMRALLSEVVTADRLPWLSVRWSATTQISMVIGPALGGMLYAVDLTLPFVFAASSLGCAAFAVLVVRRVSVGDASLPSGIDPAEILAETVVESGFDAEAVPTSGPSPWHQAREGLRFLRGESVLLGAISLDLFAVLFGGAVALLPAIAEDRLGVGAVGLGWLRAAVGIGAGLATLVLAVRPVKRRVGGTLLVSVAVFGVGTIALGLTTSFVVAFLALAVLSAADAVSGFIRLTLTPLITPPAMRGRVMAVEGVFVGASNELGAFESGVTGQLLGAGPAVVIGGVCTLLVAASWSRLFPRLGAIDQFPGLEDDEDVVVST